MKTIAPPLLSELEALRPQMAAAAQEVYDEWEPTEDFSGGICDEVASALEGVINSNLERCSTRPGGWDGDDHANIIVGRGNEAYWVDINPDIYETGGGFIWEKIPDVIFSPDDIIIAETGTDEDFTDEDSLTEALEAPDNDEDEFGNDPYTLHLEIGRRMLDFTDALTPEAALQALKEIFDRDYSCLYKVRDSYKLTLFSYRKREKVVQARDPLSTFNAMEEYLKQLDELEITDDTPMESVISKACIREALEAPDNDEDDFGERFSTVPMRESERLTLIELLGPVIAKQRKFTADWYKTRNLSTEEQDEAFAAFGSNITNVFFHDLPEWSNYLKHLQPLADNNQEPGPPDQRLWGWPKEHYSSRDKRNAFNAIEVLEDYPTIDGDITEALEAPDNDEDDFGERCDSPWMSPAEKDELIRLLQAIVQRQWKYANNFVGMSLSRGIVSTSKGEPLWNELDPSTRERFFHSDEGWEKYVLEIDRIFYRSFPDGFTQDGRWFGKEPGCYDRNARIALDYVENYDIEEPLTEALEAPENDEDSFGERQHIVSMTRAQKQQLLDLLDIVIQKHAEFDKQSDPYNYDPDQNRFFKTCTEWHHYERMLENLCKQDNISDEQIDQKLWGWGVGFRRDAIRAANALDDYPTTDEEITEALEAPENDEDSFGDQKEMIAVLRDGARKTQWMNQPTSDIIALYFPASNYCISIKRLLAAKDISRLWSERYPQPIPQQVLDDWENYSEDQGEEMTPLSLVDYLTEICYAGDEIYVRELPDVEYWP